MRTLMKFIFLSLLLSQPQAFALEVEWLVIPKKNTPEESIRQFKKHPSLIRIENVFDSREAEYLLTQTRYPELSRTLKISVPSRPDLDELKHWSRTHGDYFDFEENDSITLDSSENIPHDPFFPEQWALQNRGNSFVLKTSDIEGIPFSGVSGEDTGLTQAPPEKTGTPPILVAVLDTGIDLNHPDLKDRIHSTPAECEAAQALEECIKKERNREACEKKWASVDADQNGYPLDCHGWNVLGLVDRKTGVRGNNQVADDIGHGTHVSGIIAASRNGQGVEGVAQQVRILPVKILRESVPEPARPVSENEESAPPPAESELPKIVSFADLFSRGFLYALRNKAQIINMSLAWPRNADSLFMRKLVKIAIDQGVLVVASAGNDSSPNPVYPCLYDGVICVASHSPDGAISKFSNYGSGVDVAAPGFMILSTWLTECDDPFRCKQIYYTERLGYDLRSGTSMSAPYVSGLLARLLNAGFLPQEAYARLMIGSRPPLPSAVDPSAKKKWIRNGNADLARSFWVQPQPWVTPVKKEVLFLSWDRKSLHAQFSLELKNHWVDAHSVQVELSLDPEFNDRGIRLEQKKLDFGPIATGETSRRTGVLTFDHVGIPSEIQLKITPLVDGKKQPEVRIQMEIIVLMTPAFDDGVIEKWTLNAGDADTIKNAEIRSVQPIEGTSEQPEFFAIKKTPHFWQIFLLQREPLSSSYLIRAQGQMAGQLGTLLRIQKHESGYFLTFKGQETVDSKRVTYLKWINLNPSLEQIGSPWVYTGDLGGLPEIHHWLKKGNSRVPTWIQVGPLPAHELPAPTPWKKIPEQTIARRIYYLDDSGIHTLLPPLGYEPVQVLSATRLNGTAFLMASGKEFDREFFEISLRTDLQWETPIPLKFQSYHMIGGTQTLPILSLSTRLLSQTIGVAFGSASTRGQHRMSWISLEDWKTGQSFLGPSEELSSVHRIAGFFLDDQGHAQAFGQSMYRIEFRDLDSGTQSSTTIKRYGFMAKAIFDQFYKPLVIQREDNSYQGGLYFQSGLGVSLSSEVITPVGGQLERPAQFRILPAGGCTDLDPAARHLVYFCGSHFVGVPLKLDLIK